MDIDQTTQCVESSNEVGCRMCKVFSLQGTECVNPGCFLR